MAAMVFRDAAGSRTAPRGGDFHDAVRIHHRHRMRDAFAPCRVLADEDAGQAPILLQIRQRARHAEPS
jgi:hypothetical protein